MSFILDTRVVNFLVSIRLYTIMQFAYFKNKSLQSFRRLECNKDAK